MNISINPTYYCNFSCHFCYLTPTQLKDKKLLDLQILDDKINELQQYRKIDHVDLYGGEIGLLPEDYLKSLLQILKIYGIRSINVNTNLSVINDALVTDDVHLSVSYDFSVREQSDRVWNNMLKLDKKFSVLMLASDELIKKDVDEMILFFNLIENMENLEIKPYSSNQSNNLNVSFKEYEEFVKKWLTSKIPKKFNFMNEHLLEDVLFKEKNSFSDDHIYITPDGDFAVLEFDLNDNEYFLKCETFEDYLTWCDAEKQKVSRNKFCSECEYLGNCLSEHLRDVKNLENSCNGFKLLIDWYKNERMENTSRIVS